MATMATIYSMIVTGGSTLIIHGGGTCTAAGAAVVKSPGQVCLLLCGAATAAAIAITIHIATMLGMSTPSPHRIWLTVLLLLLRW
jgi:hypothetical protein